MFSATNRTQTYCDFAGVDEQSFIDSLRSNISSTKTEIETLRSETKHPACKPISNFPRKLHYMLEEVERDGLDDIIAWQPHGRCFVIKKPKELESKLLPLWFEQSKYSSFQRQLNIYGFKRMTSTGSALGSDKGAYFHELFLRGKPILVQGIQRYKKKGTGPRKKTTTNSEPDFYSMVPLPGLKTNGASQLQKRSPMPGYSTGSQLQTTPFSPLEPGTQYLQGRISNFEGTQVPARLRMLASSLDLLRTRIDTPETRLHSISQVRSVSCFPNANLQPNRHSTLSVLGARYKHGGSHWLPSTYGSVPNAIRNRVVRENASVEDSFKDLRIE